MYEIVNSNIYIIIEIYSKNNFYYHTSFTHQIVILKEKS